jgi:N-acetylneuraminate synthase
MKNTFIIAEAGVNHNGSVETALLLIDAAVDAGVDAVKFQTFKADKLVSKNALKAEYQKRLTEDGETQYEMLKKLELDHDAHLKLIHYCQTKKIKFLSTPFDTESADLLGKTFNLDMIKVSSGDLTNAPLLLHIARMAKSVIVSTGMSNLDEIEAALSVLAFGYVNKHSKPSAELFMDAYRSKEGQEILRHKVSLLHCTTEYPAPLRDINLKAMETLRASFGLRIGFSDHTLGITIPIAAAALGAEIIEKHFTLDRQMAGPDHQASLEPLELKEMVQAIRDVDIALGRATKAPTASEFKNIAIARKSIVAEVKINKGEPFTERNITVKRPGNGKSPMEYWSLLNRTASRDYEQDEPI